VLIGKPIPVLFVTGYNLSAIPSELSHIRCLQKPTSSTKLVRAIAELCKRKK
jgi:BarA-like signal transduction histidine kinase